MLKVLKPIALTDAMLYSHSMPEADHAAWVSATAYTVGTRVIRASTHRIYQCAVAATTADTTPPESDAAHWVEVGPTNRWAMFDQRVSTATVGNASGLSVVLKPVGRCNGLALMDLVNVRSCTVTVSWPQTGGSNSTKTEEYAYGITQTTVTTATQVTVTFDITLTNRNVSNWTEFFLEPFAIKTDAFVGFPSRANTTITLTMPAPDAGDAPPQIGALMFGNFIELGDTGYGVSAGAESYTKINTDEWGISTITERDYVKRVQYPVTVPNYGIRRAFSALAEIKSEPAVFVGSDDYRYTPFTVYGLVEDFSLGLEFSTYSIVNVTVKGIQL